MKLRHAVNPGDITPSGYRTAYHDVICNRAICYPIGIHCNVSKFEQLLVDAKADGLQEGRVQRDRERLRINNDSLDAMRYALYAASNPNTAHHRT